MTKKQMIGLTALGAVLIVALLGSYLFTDCAVKVYDFGMDYYLQARCDK